MALSNIKFNNLNSLTIYRIYGIIGELNIWQFALKMQLSRFLFGDFEYCMETNPCLQPKWCIFNLAMYIYVICQTTKLKPLPNIPHIWYCCMHACMHGHHNITAICILYSYTYAVHTVILPAWLLVHLLLSYNI